MHFFTYVTSLVSLCLLISSGSLFAEEAATITPGVVKTRDQRLFLKCEKNEHEQVCQVYLQAIGKEDEAITRPFALKKADQESETAHAGLEGQLEGKIGFVFAPLTSLCVLLPAALGNREYIPLGILTVPADIVATPVLGIISGLEKLYRLIQVGYVKDGVKTLFGMQQKKKVRLSKKDFELLVQVLRRNLN